MAWRHAKTEETAAGGYRIPDAEQFKYTLTRLHENEQEAFKEIRKIIEKEGKINKKEMKEIFIKHAPAYIVKNYPKTLDDRFRKILRDFVNDGGLEELEPDPEGFRKGGFFNHAMDRTKEAPTIVKVQGVRLEDRSIYLPKKIVSEMQLEYKTSCKFEEGRDSGGDYLMMTPLKTTAIQRRVQKGTSSCILGIPEDMLFIAGLKIDDYITWHLEEGGLFLRKAEGSDKNARKVIRTDVCAAVTIPEEFVERLGLRKGGYGIWTFDEDEEGRPRLWLELSKENPHIMAIGMIKSKDEFQVSIPQGIGKWLKTQYEAILEPKEGKLYIRKKQ